MNDIPVHKVAAYVPASDEMRADINPSIFTYQPTKRVPRPDTWRRRLDRSIRHARLTLADALEDLADYISPLAWGQERSDIDACDHDEIPVGEPTDYVLDLFRSQTGDTSIFDDLAKLAGKPTAVRFDPQETNQ